MQISNIFPCRYEEGESVLKSPSTKNTVALAVKEIFGGDTEFANQNASNIIVAFAVRYWESVVIGDFTLSSPHDQEMIRLSNWVGACIQSVLTILQDQTAVIPRKLREECRAAIDQYLPVFAGWTKMKQFEMRIRIVNTLVDIEKGMEGRDENKEMQDRVADLKKQFVSLFARDVSLEERHRQMECALKNARRRSSIPIEEQIENLRAHIAERESIFVRAEDDESFEQWRTAWRELIKLMVNYKAEFGDGYTQKLCMRLEAKGYDMAVPESAELEGW
jgi:hypothetical protein